MKYTEKTYKEARMVAQKAHQGQYYDEMFPYEKHLDDVVAILQNYGFAGKYIVAGYLHDVIEDGTTSYNDIKNYFGVEVAEMVYCVTDELGRNRKERKRKTLPKTASNRDAVIIKLADRIANIEHGGKIDMYRKEYGEFKTTLCSYEDIEMPLWNHLESLLGIEQETIKQ